MYKGKSIDIANSGKSESMQMTTTTGKWNQIFKFETNYFMCTKDKKVLEVTDGKDFEGSPVGIHKKTFTINQKWTVTYVDRAEDVKTRGMYTSMNLHLGRPFYIRSRLPM